MKRKSVYELRVLVQTKDGKKNVMTSKVEAESYEEAKSKTWYACLSQGYEVLRFMDGVDNNEW